MAIERKAGDQKYLDFTPGTLFASVPPNLFKEDYRISTKVSDFCDDFRMVKNDQVDGQITTHLRENFKRLSRTLPMTKLKQRPMFCFNDGKHCLLPLKEDGNESGLDWTTYQSPLGHKLMLALANAIEKNARTADEHDAARVQLVDYSKCQPFQNMIRKDGAMKFSGYNKETFSVFAMIMNDYLRRAFLHAYDHLESYMPNMNPSKSLGFYSMHPDGSPIHKVDYSWVPAGFESEIPNNIYRYNLAPVKQEWVSSGALMRNFDFFLAHCQEYKHDPSIVLQAMQLGAISVHTEAYRINNADTPIIDFKGDFALTIDDIRCKDRVATFEIDPYTFGLGTLDNHKFLQHIWSFGYKPSAMLKKRPMFPGPNATFSLPFIMLFRMLFHDLEQEASGFLSNRPVVLERYQRLLGDTMQNPVFVNFDRKNAEQYITDNFDDFLLMWPDWLQAVISGLGCSILPSLGGPRFVGGGLCSGTAQTTACNIYIGLYEIINMEYAIVTGKVYVDDVTLFKEIAQKHLKMAFNGEDYFDIGDFRFSSPLGTDDQLLIVTSRSMDHAKLELYVKKLMDEFGEPRSLGIDVCEEFTMFGIHGTKQEFKVAESLVLKKFCLMEHTLNGDGCALKMAAHVSMLDHFYDPIQRVFHDLKLGSLESYKKGAEQHLRLLVKFGFPVEGYMNEYNPTSALVMGTYFQKAGIDPRRCAGTYEVESLRPFAERFKQYFTKFRMWNF